MKSIVVFCGSSTGKNPLYMEEAYKLGVLLAQKNIRLVYGGTKIGLMGAVANGALDNGGEVIGILPDFLKTREIAHTGLTQLITTSNMHDRKLKMHEMSDGIITLPGGWGTMEEIYEMLTWAQLGLHHKPAGILNIDHYYDYLLLQHQKMAEEGLLNEQYLPLLQIADTAETLLYKMLAIPPVQHKATISKSQT